MKLNRKIEIYISFRMISYTNSSLFPVDSKDQLVFNKIISYFYISGEVLATAYSVLNIFWLIYVIRQIYWQFIQKRFLLLNRQHCAYTLSLEHKIFTRNESIVRYSIFLVFIIFELIFSLTLSNYGVHYFGKNQYYKPVYIGRNCTLLSATYISTIYDRTGGAVYLNINSFLESFTFSMMIWLFGVSLYHLSYAARNDIKVKIIFRSIVTGVILNVIMTIPMYIPYTSIIGVFFKYSTDQFSFLLVVYIAKRKFFPALNSRVSDAFHTASREEHKQQKLLLKRYRTMVTFLLITFELFILKNLVFYSTNILLETISANPCWFNATYNLPNFNLSDSIINNLFHVMDYFLLIIRSIDIIIYFNLIFVNIACLYDLIKRFLKQTIFNRRGYRYRLLSDPLLTNTS